jgi:CRP-like cAMP-binding protein
MVGEMALIDHRPRTATVVADGDMKLLRFKTRAFRTLLDEMPKASERVMTMLRARMQSS